MTKKLKAGLDAAARWIVAALDLVVRRPLWWVANRLGLPILGRHLSDAWTWVGRWRRIVVPTVAIVVSVATILAVLVLTDAQGERAIDRVVQGVVDDRCVRVFSANASEKRSALVDAQSRVTVETFQTTDALAAGLIAGLIEEDQQAVMVALAGLEEARRRGRADVEAVAAAATEVGRAEQQLTNVSLAAKNDRGLFRTLCRRGPG